MEYAVNANSEQYACTVKQMGLCISQSNSIVFNFLISTSLHLITIVYRKATINKLVSLIANIALHALPIFSVVRRP